MTHEEVRSRFNYVDGQLIYKKSVGPMRKGSVAGTVDKDGYTVIQVGRKLMKAHRLVWLYHYGYLPEHFLDHIDRNPSNNRVENLREVSRSCNTRNSGNRLDNKSDVKGVYYNKSPDTWSAQIFYEGRNKRLGTYGTKLEAVLARLAGEQCLGWISCNVSTPAHKYYLKHLKE